MQNYLINTFAFIDHGPKIDSYWSKSTFSILAFPLYMRIYGTAAIAENCFYRLQIIISVF